MRHRPVLFLMVLIAMSGLACGRGDRNASFRTETIDGIQHVYNTAKPSQGETALDVAEVLRIDPFEVDKDDPPLFQIAVKDDAGNLYLGDTRNVRVYKFNPDGELVTRFLKQGQGPGEFPRFGDLQVADDHIWIIGTWPLKIAKYTLDGRYVNEWNFRTFQNFYLRTQVISEGRYLTVSYRDGAEIQDRVRVSALMNSREEWLTVYSEDRRAGIFRIRTGPGEGPAIASTSPLVAADIHHAYDPQAGVLYVCNNREYEIRSKGIDGTPRKVIHKAHDKIFLDEDKKERILQLIAPRISPAAKQGAKEQLPDALNAIMGIAVLPNGHLAVKRITGLESIVIDIFDGDGRFVSTILPSAEIPDLRNLTIFRNTLGVIKESEEKNLFVEYRATHMKGIID